ncbi:MAG TPA: xylose isomerase, partial [Cyclobacteriaceae bacterium]|nr:xylose isomerase [Cyclobacteriaceae bacterium]
MNTPHGHLTYCTNIHPGESWVDHFGALRQHIPEVKKRVSPNQPFGIGLRLSDLASRDLIKDENLSQFIQWLKTEDCYVFTMNGFPYGGFHRTKVKDHVHTPDWTTYNRVEYTIRLFDILSNLLPKGMEGGISTSPLSYRLWHTEDKKSSVFEITTKHVLHVVE